MREDEERIQISDQEDLYIYVGRYLWQGGMEYRAAEKEDLKKAMRALDRKSCDEIWAACGYLALPDPEDIAVKILREALDVIPDAVRTLPELANDIVLELNREHERAAKAEKEVKILREVRSWAREDDVRQLEAEKEAKRLRDSDLMDLRWYADHYKKALEDIENGVEIVSPLVRDGRDGYRMAADKATRALRSKRT